MIHISNSNSHRDKICHPHHHPLSHHHCLLPPPSILYSKFTLFCSFRNPISIHTLSIACVIGIFMLFIIRFDTGDAAIKKSSIFRKIFPRVPDTSHIFGPTFHSIPSLSFFLTFPHIQKAVVPEKQGSSQFRIHSNSWNSHPVVDRCLSSYSLYSLLLLHPIPNNMQEGNRVDKPSNERPDRLNYRLITLWSGALTVLQLRVVQLRDELTILYWESVVIRVVWNECVTFEEKLNTFSWLETLKVGLLGWRLRLFFPRILSTPRVTREQAELRDEFFALSALIDSRLTTAPIQHILHQFPLIRFPLLICVHCRERRLGTLRFSFFL